MLVGPDGQDLDLFHSLFYHDTTARWTEDYIRYVIKGLAKSKLDKGGDVVRRLPLGKHYTTITEAGHTRENGYVANYGEATNYLPEWFHRTWGHKGDEELNDRILEIALRNLHARSLARMTDLDDNLRRTMRMEMVIDERNTNYPGFPGLRAADLRGPHSQLRVPGPAHGRARRPVHREPLGHYPYVRPRGGRFRPATARRPPVLQLLRVRHRQEQVRPHARRDLRLPKRP